MNKGDKRGQVTLFIIVAILIVAAVLLFLFVLREAQKAEEISPQQIASIKSYLSDYVRNSIETSIFYTFESGGYLNPKNKFESYDFTTAFYYFEGEKTIPSKGNFEEAIKSYSSILIKNLDLNTEFKDLKIKQGNPIINSAVFDENIAIDVNLPINIKKNDAITELKEDYHFEYNIRIGIILEAVSEIVNEISKNPQNVAIENLFNIQEKYDIKIDATIINDETAIYTITDNNSLILNEPIRLYFAIKS